MEQQGIIRDIDTKKNIVVSRRSFFGTLLGIGTAGMGAILAVPVLRYVLYPLYSKASGSGWSDVGSPSEFANSKEPVRKTITFSQRDGWREVVTSQSVYISHAADGQLAVLSAICPHLGCTVSWQQGQGRFVCPCHGAQFKPDGALLLGPAPRGMDSLPTQTKDGKLQVHFEYFREDVPNKEKLS